MAEVLTRDLSDGILTLTLDRPESRNALDQAAVDALHAAFGEAEHDDAVSVVVLTGAAQPGHPAEKQIFIARADIRQLKERTVEDAFRAINSALFRRIGDFPKATIAAMAGSAFGGGLEIAMACDLRVASTSGKYGLTETGLGILPGAGGTQRLPRLVGLGRAKEMIFTGKLVDGAEAARIGLVTRAAPPDQVLPVAMELARTIQARGPIAVRLAKRAVDLSASLAMNDGFYFEILAQAATFGSKDKVEGMSAFLEKRKAKFTGA